MTEQNGTTRQIGDGVTRGISEEMNCDNRGKNKLPFCGPYGHSLDVHVLRDDGRLDCKFCGAICAYKPHPLGTF